MYEMLRYPWCLQLVEQAAKKFVCIVDDSKLVDGLGGSKGECFLAVKEQHLMATAVRPQMLGFGTSIFKLCAADAMPVEIVQFCYKYNLGRLQDLPELAGSKAKLRMNGDKPYVTDNQNYIVDLYFEEPLKDPYAAAEAIGKLTGIVDHGLFLDMVDVVVIASKDGVKLQEK